MKIVEIKKYLKPYKVLSRWTTFNGAIQHALAAYDEYDEYDEKKIKELLKILGQKENEHLKCIYCKRPADSWDHLHNNVQKSKHSGYGNRIFNLVPACIRCNVSKCPKHWEIFIKDNKYKLEISKKLRKLDQKFESTINSWDKIQERCPDLAKQYEEAIKKLQKDLANFDNLAQQIREQMKR